MRQLQKPTLYDYISLFVLSAIWATAFIGIEIVIEEFEIVHVTYGRVVLASLVLFPFIAFKKWILPKDLKIWFFIFLSAIFNTAVPFSLINYGQQYITSGMSALMLGFGPFITLLLAHFLTHDEKFSKNKLISIIFGFIGLVILLGTSVLAFDLEYFHGQIAVLLASLSYVTSSVLLRKIKDVSFYHLSFIMFFISTIVLTPFAFSIPFDSDTISLSTFLVLLYLGIFPTAIASLFRIQMVQKVGVQFMSQVAYLIPLFALIWAWVLLGEIPQTSTYVALVIILIGMYIGKQK